MVRPRLPRALFAVSTVLSLLLCLAVCVLWARSLGGYDQLLWAYDRWLPSGGAASNQVELMSDSRL